MRRPEIDGQIPAFDVPLPPPPRGPKPRNNRGQVRYVKFKPRVRTLCHDCVRDIHERGIHIAPPPLTVSWKRHFLDDVDLICEQHKRQEFRDD